jgi:hypothetical protein
MLRRRTRGQILVAMPGVAWRHYVLFRSVGVGRWLAATTSIRAAWTLMRAAASAPEAE